MQNSIERNKLSKALDREPAHAWTVLVKCAAGITILVLVCAAGIRWPLAHPTVADSAATAAPPAGEGVQAHRKQVSESRRSRFQRRSDGQSFARETVQPANRLSTIFR